MHMRLAIIMLLLLIGIVKSSVAQSYFTRDGQIRFFSKSTVENIQAENHQVLAIIDTDKKEVAFNLLIKGFLFEKQLMQDHFNEDVMESNQYPKASFTGKIIEVIQLGKNHVHLKGKLTIHGITKPLNTEADMELQSGNILGKCSFKVSLADYNIKIPSVLKNNISPNILVTVNVNCRPVPQK